jgi:hypothetical protein
MRRHRKPRVLSPLAIRFRYDTKDVGNTTKGQFAFSVREVSRGSSSLALRLDVPLPRGSGTIEQSGDRLVPTAIEVSDWGWDSYPGLMPRSDHDADVERDSNRSLLPTHTIPSPPRRRTNFSQ